ncbi:RNA-binding S4 domain-containing protein [Blastomonas fulva]|uniref:RNA-binding S4 domain-containing protein n=1 Tax=Blastomonas fulva TaxID=1550728 RepID=UPI0025A42697|nr:S4 domain-containing protein [Blastomonas fulva]MDM7927836.1 S4 domain-containing protein [Blastomonas fulva]MDM7965704.1 S4 domain-containing protein [Blastomonas fulva]
MAETGGSGSGAGGHMRMDVLLWYLRLVRSRSQGKSLAEQGVIRSNGTRVIKAHHAVRCGDILTVPQGSRVLVLQIDHLPWRRGPAEEAIACYREPEDRRATG